jgi:hypothetical protein
MPAEDLERWLAAPKSWEAGAGGTAAPSTAASQPQTRASSPISGG